MNARRDSSDGPETGSFSGRALLIGAVFFAAAATGLLVLTDQEKWLRLGIVAALWAALTGAFLAARYRRQLTDQRAAAVERQEIYELELEREIAARREHELTVEAEARRKAEEASRDDIAALRGELANLRQTLEGLMGGEFLVERYALQAEATRMRSLEGDRSLAVRRDVKHLPAAQSGNVVVPPVVREAETDLIDRIREVHQKPRREQPPARPEPRVADSRPPSVPRQPDRPPRPAPAPEPVKPPAQPRIEHPAEMSDRWFVPDGLLDGTPPQPPRRSEQPRRQEPQRPADPPPTPAPAPRRPMAGWDQGQQEWGLSREQQRAQPPRPEPMPDTGAPLGGRAEQTSWLAQYNKPADTSGAMYGSRAYVPPAARPDPPSQRNMDPVSQRNIEPVSQRNIQPVGHHSLDPASQRNIEPVGYRGMDPASQRNIQPVGHHNLDPASQRNIEPVGHRHRVEDENAGGGRRRRAEGQPSWQETVGHREESTGNHASGRSVSELLANHGLDSSPRRRRRRED